MAALRPAAVTLAGRGSPERIDGARVTASSFQVLRVPPARGQVFGEGAGLPGGERVAVLGDGL